MAYSLYGLLPYTRSLSTDDIPLILEEAGQGESLKEFQLWWAFQSACVRRRESVEALRNPQAQQQNKVATENTSDHNAWSLSNFLGRTGSIHRTFINLQTTDHIFQHNPSKFLSRKALKDEYGLFLADDEPCRPLSLQPEDETKTPQMHMDVIRYEGVTLKTPDSGRRSLGPFHNFQIIQQHIANGSNNRNLSLHVPSDCIPRSTTEWYIPATHVNAVARSDLSNSPDDAMTIASRSFEHGSLENQRFSCNMNAESRSHITTKHPLSTEFEDSGISFTRVSRGEGRSARHNNEILIGRNNTQHAIDQTPSENDAINMAGSLGQHARGASQDGTSHSSLATRNHSSTLEQSGTTLATFPNMRRGPRPHQYYNSSHQRHAQQRSYNRSRYGWALWQQDSSRNSPKSHGSFEQRNYSHYHHSNNIETNLQRTRQRQNTTNGVTGTRYSRRDDMHNRSNRHRGQYRHYYEHQDVVGSSAWEKPIGPHHQSAADEQSYRKYGYQNKSEDRGGYRGNREPPYSNRNPAVLENDKDSKSRRAKSSESADVTDNYNSKNLITGFPKLVEEDSETVGVYVNNDNEEGTGKKIVCWPMVKPIRFKTQDNPNEINDCDYTSREILLSQKHNGDAVVDKQSQTCSKRQSFSDGEDAFKLKESREIRTFGKHGVDVSTRSNTSSSTALSSHTQPASNAERFSSLSCGKKKGRYSTVHTRVQQVKETILLNSKDSPKHSNHADTSTLDDHALNN